MYQDTPIQTPRVTCCGRPKRGPLVPSVRLTALLKPLHWRHKLGLGVAVVASVAHGATFPAFSVVFGSLFNVVFLDQPELRAASTTGKP